MLALKITKPDVTILVTEQTATDTGECGGDIYIYIYLYIYIYIIVCQSFKLKCLGKGWLLKSFAC